MKICTDRNSALLRNLAGRIDFLGGKEAAASSSFNARAERYGCEGILDRYAIRQAYEKSNRCFWCNHAFSKRVRKTIDHIWPLSKKGPNVVSNLVPSCHSCNSRKSNRNPISFACEIGRGDLVAAIYTGLSDTSIKVDDAIAECERIVIYSQWNRKRGAYLYLVRNYREYMGSLYGPRQFINNEAEHKAVEFAYASPYRGAVIQEKNEIWDSPFREKVESGSNRIIVLEDF